MTEEINPAGLPVLPDSVARKLDKGQDVSMEEVREAAIDNLKSGRTNPVHAEDLKPISRATASSMTTQQPGGKLPSMPATRRVIPAPFRRPRIAVEHHGKEWRRMDAQNIVPGDIVPGVGQVAGCEERVRYAKRSEVLAGIEIAPAIEKTIGQPDPDVAVGLSIVLTGIEGMTRVLDLNEEVQVFR